MRGKRARELRKEHLKKASTLRSFQKGYKSPGTTVEWEGGRRDYRAAKVARQGLPYTS